MIDDANYTLNQTNALDYFNSLNDNSYKYSFVFFFERKCFDNAYTSLEIKWINENWNLSILYALVYISLVFLGQRLMKNREKFHLYRSLVAWNVVLAIFSIMGTLRFLPYFISFLYINGFENSVCLRIHRLGVPVCWLWYFVMSKMIELIDTLFIVLRKQKLIFLHWYHHATVLIYTWYSLKDLGSTGPWFIAMNYFVHSLMYSYYALRAMRVFNIPKIVNIIITSLQLSQMLVGIMVNLVAFIRKSRGEMCQVSYENIYASFFMYFTYFCLFFHFFRNAYLKKSVSSDKQKLK